MTTPIKKIGILGRMQIAELNSAPHLALRPKRTKHRTWSVVWSFFVTALAIFMLWRVFG